MLKKKTWGSLMLLALTMQSCTIDSFLEGEEEKFVIENINSGTLDVDDEPSWECFYEIGENPYGVKAIHFFANGTCQLLYTLPSNMGGVPAGTGNTPVSAEGVSRAAQDDEQEEGGFTPDMGTHAVRLVPRMFRRSVSSSVQEDLAIKSYTRIGKRYVITDFGWVVEDGTLYVEKGGKTETYSAKAGSASRLDAVSERLCHTWVVSEALGKIYKKGTNKLLETYHVTEEDLREDGLYRFVFARNGLYYCFNDSGRMDGYGTWNWINIGEQALHLWYFDIVDYERDEIKSQVYFANNNLYITINFDIHDDEDIDFAEDLEAHGLLQLKAVGIER